jgi:glycosyltransferase involved in cell wall biosynthesis
VISDGDDGRVVPRGDTGRLAAAMRELAGDGALRDRLGRGARARALASFSSDRMVERYLALFGRLVKR